MPTNKRMRYWNTCNRCNCYLDPGEGQYCERCQEEMAEEETYAKRWGVTVQQVRDMKRKKLIITSTA